MPSVGSVDVIAFLVGIKQSVCERINDQLGIDMGAGVPLESAINLTVEMVTPKGATKPVGLRSGIGGVINGKDDQLQGKPSGCFVQGGQYVYYHVFVAR